MAKGQKRIQQQAEKRSEIDYASAHAAENRIVNNPNLQGMEARNAVDRAMIDNGTFQNSSRYLSNRDAVAQRIAGRNGSMNLARTGFGALGARYVAPQQLALADDIRRDENARDIGLQAEQDKRDFVNQTYLNEDNAMKTRIGADTNIMASARGSSINYLNQAAQIASQRASILPGILGAGISAAGNVLGGAAAAGRFI